MEVILINRSDLKNLNGFPVLKRKYGKFKRETFVIDTNTKEGREILKQINQ